MEAAQTGEAAGAMADLHDVPMQQEHHMAAREDEAPIAEAVVPSVSEDAVVPRKFTDERNAKRRHL